LASISRIGVGVRRGEVCYRGTRVTCMLLLLASLTACTSQRPLPPTSVDGSESPSTHLWGEMTPTVSVKELMRDVIDPLSDHIFDSVGEITTAAGTVVRQPTTDQDWARVRVGAVAMAETSYLLKVKRPFAPPGDLNDSVGPEAVELSPAQITEKVTKDPVEWNARIEALRNIGLSVMNIEKQRDASLLWDAAEELDRVCEECHRSYWYPKETPEYYRKLDRRLDETFGK
jgi:hypothetical protein